MEKNSNKCCTVKTNQNCKWCHLLELNNLFKIWIRIMRKRESIAFHNYLVNLLSLRCRMSMWVFFLSSILFDCILSIAIAWHIIVDYGLEDVINISLVSHSSDLNGSMVWLHTTYMYIYLYEFDVMIVCVRARSVNVNCDCESVYIWVFWMYSYMNRFDSWITPWHGLICLLYRMTVSCCNQIWRNVD